MSTFDLPNDFQPDRPHDSDRGARPDGNQQPSPAGGRPYDIERPQVRSLESLLDSVRDDLFSGKRPVQYAVASEPWGSIALRPGDVLGIAGPPGVGKTAVAMQFVVNALRLHPDASCLVANVEMSPQKLIERQISRLSGVAFADIADRVLLGPQVHQIEAAIATLRSVGKRMFFMQEPYNLEEIGRSLVDVQPRILLLDYIQRIDCGDSTLEARIRLNSVMSEARRIASAGIAVVLVSAVGRTTSKRDGGYSSRELGLGSFRESSEIEYGLDDAFVLTDEDGSSEDNGGGPRVVHLRHVKSRNHQRRDLRVEFDGAVQQFRLLPDRAENESRPETPTVVPPAASGAVRPVVDRWVPELVGDGLL